MTGQACAYPTPCFKPGVFYCRLSLRARDSRSVFPTYGCGGFAWQGKKRLPMYGPTENDERYFPLPYMERLKKQAFLLMAIGNALCGMDADTILSGTYVFSSGTVERPDGKPARESVCRKNDRVGRCFMADGPCMGGDCPPF